MGVVTSTLLFLLLCFKVIQSEASSWTVAVPSTVKGHLGSCVVIPCSYSYPDPGRKVTAFTGIWTNSTGHVIYHQVNSKVVPEYRTRTELLGDVTQKNCSLKINPLQQSDRGPFHFRIEIGDYNSYSYKEKQVSIAIISDTPPGVSVREEEVVEGQTVTASCSVSHSCPPSPPNFTWSHTGVLRLQSLRLNDGQWRATSTLTFNSTKADHNKSLLCAVTQGGRGRQESVSSVLKVKHAPVNVQVYYRSDVKEGEAVQLRCSSEGYPPASSYRWHDDRNAQLHRGQSYTLPNVSRHTGALICTAVNTVGQSKSSPVQISPFFAPEISTISCSSEGDVVTCVCIVESKPPSTVRFELPDKVLPSPKTEKHGYATIATLQAESGSSRSVRCVANNTMGNANVTFTLAVNSHMQNLYVFIAIGAGASLMMVLIILGVVKKCRGRGESVATSQIRATKNENAVELPRFAKTKSVEMDYDDVHSPGIYSNDHIYGNMETGWDEDIYANIC